MHYKEFFKKNILEFVEVQHSSKNIYFTSQQVICFKSKYLPKHIYPRTQREFDQ